VVTEVRAQLQNPVQVEGIYPSQALRGETTVVSVAMPRGSTVQSATVTPADGVRVAKISGSSESTEQAIGWWDVAIEVAADAAPGDRTLVLTTPMGSTPPLPLAIPTHVPAISNLVVTPASANQPVGEVRVTVADSQNDLGDAPYVWFAAKCGSDDPIGGALRAKVAAGVARASLPELRGSCAMRVHVTDAKGSESNTLPGSATFATVRRATVRPTVPGATVQTAPPQDWAEFMNREDRFSISFPGQPVTADTIYASQYGAFLPARIYSGAEGSARYTVTVVDYNPLHRILSERSRTLPALDLAVHDYGIGYWKTDVRGASVFAASKFLERDGKVTSLLSNFADGVVGIQVLFVSNADQARTFCSIYMHANRLVIAEATVPRGYPAPLIFQQSLGWLDERGMRIRYQSPMNYNEPDAPRTTAQPPGQGRGGRGAAGGGQ
jgi:hypothetical protein